MRKRSGGARQRAWDILLQSNAQSASALAEQIGVEPGTISPYLNGLIKHGYLVRDSSGQLALKKKTGPRAPGWSVHSGELVDWNIVTTASPEALHSAIKSSGLSISAWLRAAGIPEYETTRVRQMINGQRPISSRVAAAIARTA